MPRSRPDATPASTDSARKQRHPVPYGHACAGCSQAKCKCNRSTLSATCERCQRLEQACEPSRAPRKRGGGRPPNRTEQIEKRLDTLVNILQPQNQTVPNIDGSGIPLPVLGPAYTPIHSEAPNILDPVSHNATIESHEAQSGSTNTSPTLLNDASPPQAPDQLFTDLESLQAQESLRLFRTSLLPVFPVVHIPPSLTSDQLRLQRPYLWLAIQSLCSTPLSARFDMQEKVRRILAEQVMVQYECNVDLLLGYLLLATWGPLIATRKNAYYVGVAAVISLVQNLKLDHSPGSDYGGFMSFAYPSVSASIVDRQPQGPVQRTNEERRAVLACFCLCSNTSHKLGTPPMRWTTHLEECMRHLASQPECDNDEILVTQTRCAKLLDDVCYSSPHGFWGFENSTRLNGNVASTILAKPLKDHLVEVRSQVRPQIQQKRSAMFWLLLAEVMILDLELQSPGPVASSSLNFVRAKSLQSCLTAVNLFFDNFFSMKPQEHSGLHFHYWLHLTRCARVVYRLIMTDDPAWDSSIILESVDLLGAIQRTADICKAIPAAMGLVTNGKEAWTIFGANQQRMKHIWRDAFVTAGIMPASENTAVEVQPEPFGSAGVNDLYSFDLFGDAWMTDALI